MKTTTERCTWEGLTKHIVFCFCFFWQNFNLMAMRGQMCNFFFDSIFWSTWSPPYLLYWWWMKPVCLCIKKHQNNLSLNGLNLYHGHQLIRWSQPPPPQKKNKDLKHACHDDLWFNYFWYSLGSQHLQGQGVDDWKRENHGKTKLGCTTTVF